jgi:hypothetical protein
MPIANYLARGFAILRSLIGLVFSVLLVAMPEPMMPGSSLEPARTLVLVFVSRIAAFSIALAVLAVRDQRRALAWLLRADVAMQVFDAALGVAGGDYISASLPIAIGVFGFLASQHLARTA